MFQRKIRKGKYGFQCEEMLVAAAAVLVVTTLADLVGSRGFPGAGWSHQELLITKAKLWRMFSPGEAWRILLEGLALS